MEPVSNVPPPSQGSDQSDILQLKNALQNSLASCEAAERRAEAAEKSRNELEHFAYALAHDLKAPLRSMLSFSQLLERRLAEDKDIRDWTGHIISGAGDMQVLIESVLRYFNVAKSSSRTNVRLDVIVQLAILKVNKLIKESNAVVRFSELPEVAINESQFVDLFSELITNSVRYRSERPLEIEVSSQDRGDVHAVLFRDNGVGIPSEYWHSVFEPFKRLHGSKIPGVGLGLAICRKIVEAHGGEIDVESDGHIGSTVRFTIPAA